MTPDLHSSARSHEPGPGRRSILIGGAAALGATALGSVTASPALAATPVASLSTQTSPSTASTLSIRSSGAASSHTLRIAGAVAPTSYDRYNGGDGDYAFTYTLLWGDRLLASDERGHYRPWLAEDLGSWSDDYLTYTVTIRHGVTFHDGTNLTAADVAASFNRLNSETGLAKSVVWSRYLTRATAHGKYQVTLHFGTPMPSFYAQVSMFPIIPARHVRTGATDAAFWARPIGSGPYRFDPADSANLTFVRNEHWWGWGVEGHANVDRLVFSTVSGDSAVNGLAAGDYDIVQRVALGTSSAVDAAVASGAKDVPLTYDKREYLAYTVARAVQDGGYIAASAAYDSSGQFVAGVTVEDALFADVRLREAVSLAVDRAALAQLRGGGPVELWSGLPGAIGYDDTQPYEYDPTKARQLLADAGFDSTTVVYMFAENATVLSTITKQLAAIGMTVEPTAFNPLNPSTWAANKDKPADLNSQAYNERNAEGIDELTGLISVDRQNTGYLLKPEGRQLRALIDQAVVTPELESWGIRHDVYQYERDQYAPYAWMYLLVNRYVVAGDVTGHGILTYPGLDLRFVKVGLKKATPIASLQALDDGRTKLTVTVTETYADGSTTTYTTKQTLTGSGAGIHSVGGEYRVFVDVVSSGEVAGCSLVSVPA
ncbi:ABC transporter substrate-binding protein [Streptomyces sp. NPDC001663]|uniref:ABC transporter substrate-binding protein n=1 Tax=Streptomyces sp. NPDC001663 TaxID=3364597 RepID=UPI0036CA902A